VHAKACAEYGTIWSFLDFINDVIHGCECVMAW